MNHARSTHIHVALSLIILVLAITTLSRPIVSNTTITTHTEIIENYTTTYCDGKIARIKNISLAVKLSYIPVGETLVSLVAEECSSIKLEALVPATMRVTCSKKIIGFSVPVEIAEKKDSTIKLKILNTPIGKPIILVVECNKTLKETIIITPSISPQNDQKQSTKTTSPMQTAHHYFTSIHIKTEHQEGETSSHQEIPLEDYLYTALVAAIIAAYAYHEATRRKHLSQYR